MLTHTAMRQVRRFGASRTLHTFQVEGRLTQHEIEAAQSQRTVNRVTPGKMFMINFIAGEQSVASIANRVNSVAVVAVGGLLLALLWGNPIEASWILPALGVYAPIFMHYHIGTKGSVPVAALMLALFLFKAHVEQ